MKDYYPLPKLLICFLTSTMISQHNECGTVNNTIVNLVTDNAIVDTKQLLKN